MILCKIGRKTYEKIRNFFKGLLIFFDFFDFIIIIIINGAGHGPAIQVGLKRDQPNSVGLGRLAAQQSLSLSLSLSLNGFGLDLVEPSRMGRDGSSPLYK
jgi:hypothetical protein